MSEKARRAAEEAYRNADRTAEHKDAGPEAQSLFGFDLGAGGTFCDNAQHGIDAAQGLIKRFSMFIPNKEEREILKVLAGLEAALPFVCEDDAAAAAATGARAKP